MVTVLADRLHNTTALLDLYAKRVLFFVGKGGVGKTTLATAMALAAARRGKKTLLIELEENTRAARLLGLSGEEPPVSIPRPVSPTLWVVAISGAAALEEYLGLILPAKRLVRTVLRSRLYQYFLAAAPGLKELMMMGKVWYEERQRETAGVAPRWDLLIVDMPATGHSLQYLQMPGAAHHTFGEGLVRQKATQVMNLFRNPLQTAICLVTVPEELPVTETLELHQRLVDELQFPIGALFVNRIRSAPVRVTSLRHIRIPTHLPFQERQAAAQALAWAKAEARLAAEQAAVLRRLAKLALPLVGLPFCFSEVFGLPEIERLSSVMDEVACSAPAKTQKRR